MKFIRKWWGNFINLINKGDTLTVKANVFPMGRANAGWEATKLNPEVEKYFNRVYGQEPHS
jgi:hypothetical protein